MKQRPSARLLLLNANKCVLLIKFEHTPGLLAGQTFWATPGGALKAGESFETSAKRELMEEVGIYRDEVGVQVAQRSATFRVPDGEMVEADERYFLVHADDDLVSDENWTATEREVMSAHRWWNQADLRSATEQIWPEDIENILIEAGEWAAAD